MLTRRRRGTAKRVIKDAVGISGELDTTAPYSSRNICGHRQEQNVCHNRDHKHCHLWTDLNSKFPNSVPTSVTSVYVEQTSPVPVLQSAANPNPSDTTPLRRSHRASRGQTSRSDDFVQTISSHHPPTFQHLPPNTCPAVAQPLMYQQFTNQPMMIQPMMMN